MLVEQKDAVLAKVSAIWAGTFFGIQLSDVVLLLTGVYTVIQIVLTLRREWRNRDK